MTDVAVLSRIDEIRSTLAGLQTRFAPATTSGAAFATSLAAATGAGTTTTDGPAAGTSASADGEAVAADAKRYLGIPYRWGGTDPKTGLDCSGLLQRVFADVGVTLPRTVSEQKNAGVPVPSMAQARPGDLLVMDEGHIGIYLGDNKILHAPKTGDVVKISEVWKTPVSIRRIVGADTGATQVAGVARPSALRGSDSGPSRFDALFASATQRYGLPPGLLKAVAKAESGFNPSATSPAGARGLMQLMPGTARELGVNPLDPSQAVDGAARLLRRHLDSFGSVRLAVAAYNAGPGAVRKYGGVPPYAETQTYVRRVLANMGAAA